MSKRKSLAVVAALAAFAAVSASAASLGTLSGASLGAGATVVASCDGNGANVTYTTAYASGPKEFQVSAVKLANLDAACNGLKAELVLSDSTGAQIGTGTVNPVAGLVGATGTLTIPLAANVSAKSVENVAVVISG